MRYVLKDQGYPFKFIYAARRKVGRVYRHADGYYVGMIGRTEKRGASEREAFDNVVAADCGYDTAADLNAHNRSVRAANRQSREAANHALDQMMGGKFDALLALFGSDKKSR